MNERDFALATAFSTRLMDAARGYVTGVLAYGSRARGDHDAESDLDLAIIVARPEDAGSVRDVARPLAPVPISTVVLTHDDLARAAAFIDNLRRDAVPIAGDAARLLAKPYSAAPWDISRDEIELSREMLQRMDRYDVATTIEATRHDAYYVLFRLARALLFARTGSAPYRHRSVRDALRRLAEREPEWEAFADALDSAARARVDDDYGSIDRRRPTVDDAVAARATAQRWFADVTRALADR